MLQLYSCIELHISCTAYRGSCNTNCYARNELYIACTVYPDSRTGASIAWMLAAQQGVARVPGRGSSRVHLLRQFSEESLVERKELDPIEWLIGDLIRRSYTLLLS